eukprot:scaffold12357_cov91-Skeletonema_dohrnii-CCMP3373.AAC.8
MTLRRRTKDIGAGDIIEADETRRLNVSTTTISTTTTADDVTTASTTQSSSPSIIATVKPTALTDPIEFTVFGSVINYSLEDPPQTTAKDILDNSESRNGVLDN